MASIGQNFEIYQGEVKIIRLPIVDDDNLPLDLTNATITFKVYRKTTKEVVITKTLSDGISAVGPLTDGVIDITIDTEDTRNLNIGKFNHQCGVTDAVGPSIVCVGTVDILENVIT